MVGDMRDGGIEQYFSPTYSFVGIIIQAYSPLVRMEKSDDPTLVKVAKEVGKEPSQVLIRWSLQKG